MAVLEPSTPSLLIWDVAGEEPIEITRFGRYGSNPGLLIRPEGIAIDPDARRAYVADPGQMTISVFDITRPKQQGLDYLPELVRFVKALDLRAIDDPTRPIWPIEPAAIKLGPKNELWVVDAANNRVVAFDERLSFLRAIGEIRPSRATSSGEGSNRGASRAGQSPSGARNPPDSQAEHETRPTTPDQASPKDQRDSDARESSDLRLIGPTDLALSPSGDTVYVVDGVRACVQAYDLSGKHLRTIGHRGADATEFIRPFGIAVASDGDLYVTDEGADKVVRFDSSSTPKHVFGKRGIGRVEFFKPKGIAFDAKGELLVLDWGNHRGQVLTPDGEFRRAFGSRIFIVPTLKKP